MIDANEIPAPVLVEWARKRISADFRTLKTLAVQAGAVAEGDQVTASLGDAGYVAFSTDDSIYVLGPSTALIGQTADGREQLWRDGELVYDMHNPAAED